MAHVFTFYFLPYDRHTPHHEDARLNNIGKLLRDHRFYTWESDEFSTTADRRINTQWKRLATLVSNHTTMNWQLTHIQHLYTINVSFSQAQQQHISNEISHGQFKVIVMLITTMSHLCH